MDLIAALRSFVRVAQTGSFSAVAQERGVTQPSISRQVSALEEALGARLVHRSTQAVSLTEDGRHFIEPAMHTLAEVERLLQTVGVQRDQAIGRVRVALPAPLGFHVASQLGRLAERHPSLTVELIVREGASSIVEEGLDLEIRLGRAEDPAVMARLIGLTQAYIVASPTYLAGQPAPKHPHDLAAHNCLVYQRWGPEDTWWFRQAPSVNQSVDGELSVNVKGNLRSNSAEVVYRAVLEGQGIAQMSHLTVADDLKSGRLVALLCGYPTRRFPIYALYPAQHTLSTRTRVVLDFIAELVMEDPAMAPLHDIGP